MADSTDAQHGASDEYIDPYCDPCFDAKGLNIKVYGYCQDCVQFLCSDCKIFHGKFNLARGHVIVRGPNMPQTQADKPPKFDNCDTHTTLLKNQFCSTHKRLICSSCFSDHECCIVGHVKDVCKSMNTSEIDKLYDSVKSLRDQARAVTTSIETNMGEAKKQKKAILKEAQDLYDNFISKVNKLFQDMQSEIEANFRTQASLLFRHKEGLSDTIGKLDASLSAIDKLKGKPIDIKLFLELQEHVHDTNEITEGLKCLNESLHFADLSFVPSREIQDFLCLSDKYGSLSKKESKPGVDLLLQRIAFPSSPAGPTTVSVGMPGQSTHQTQATPGAVSLSNVPLAQIKATKQGTFRIKKDRKDCDITGIAVTRDERRIIVDYANMKAKLFSKDMKFLSSISLTSPPWDIAMINDKQAVVTTHDNSLITLDILGTKLRIRTTTQLPYDVLGLTRYNDKLIVTSPCSKPPSVKLISLNGRVYWSVSVNQEDQPLFTTNLYVSSHGDGTSSTVVVTDSGNGTLTLLNGNTGEVVNRHQLLEKYPRGVTTDSTGKVYVCYWGTREVSVLSDTLSKEKILLTRKDGLTSGPQAITYDDITCQLIISYDIDNNIDFFKLS